MVRPPEIRISHDSQTWAAAAAELVHAVGQEAVQAKGQFLIALSGGTTPETLYRALASPAFADRFNWSRTTFFFSDERCVPPDDPRSNYALAHKTLFTPLKIAPSQVIVWQGNPVTQRRRPMSINSNCVLQLKPCHPSSHPLTSFS